MDGGRADHANQLPPGVFWHAMLARWRRCPILLSQPPELLVPLPALLLLVVFVRSGGSASGRDARFLACLTLGLLASAQSEQTVSSGTLSKWACGKKKSSLAGGFVAASGSAGCNVPGGQGQTDEKEEREDEEEAQTQARPGISGCLWLQKSRLSGRAILRVTCFLRVVAPAQFLLMECWLGVLLRCLGGPQIGMLAW